MEAFVIEVGSYPLLTGYERMIVFLKADGVCLWLSAALFVTYNESSSTAVDLDRTSTESALKEP